VWWIESEERERSRCGRAVMVGEVGDRYGLLPAVNVSCS